MRIHRGAWVPLALAALSILEANAQFIRQSCGIDDFRCNNGQCIEIRKACNGIVDCPDGEDEKDCTCGEDEFRCEINGACIESRKRCDGIGNCLDGSDELYCTCRSDQWQCDQGQCIDRSKRCNGKVDCPADRSDERQCIANEYFKCDSGKMIPKAQRCDRHYDCPTGDYSDEHNCPCRVEDFKCNNGYCIPKEKQCDRTHDCQDRSDELGCNYGKQCMAYEFQCKSGQCIPAEGLCNGTAECKDWSDEHKCPCKRGQFRCREGSCISLGKRCDGKRDCRQGEDELLCGGDEECPQGQMECSPGSSVQCASRCNGVSECDSGEDEQDCEDCHHYCDNYCLEDSQICDGNIDCSDGSDEKNCINCDGPDDFRCQNDECIQLSQRCNNISECSDGSDEYNCNRTMIATQEGCLEGQFRCQDGSCISQDFRCDGNIDCYDQSDENNCPWYMTRASRSPSTAPCQSSEFTCNNGKCVRGDRRCDNIYDCSDFSDEQNCYAASKCQSDEYQCVSGECILSWQKCDGRPDCRDGDDESGCPSNTTPYQPTSTAYPDIYSPGRDQNGDRRPDQPRQYDPYGRPGYPSGTYDNRDPYAPSTESPRDYGTLRTTGDDSDSTTPDDSDNDIYGTATTDAGYDTPQTTQSPYQRPYLPGGSSENGGNSYPYGGYPYSTQAPSAAPDSNEYPTTRSPNQGSQSGYPGGSDPYGSGSNGQTYPGAGSQEGQGSNYPSGQDYPGQSGQGYPESQGGQGRYPGGQDYPGQGGQSYPGQGGQGGSGYPGGQGGSEYPGGQDYPGQSGQGYPGSQGGQGGQGSSGYPGGQGGSEYPGGQDYPGQSGQGYPGSGYPGGQGGSYPGGQNGQGYPGAGEQGGPSGDPYGAGYPNYGGSTSQGYPGGRPSGGSQSGGARGSTVACKRYEWRCENGPCIDERLRCNGHIDCPFDFSDEFDCPIGSPVALNVKTYPDEQSVRFGGDVVFQCRDEGPIRAPVRWIREGGRPLKPGSIDRNGRLELFGVTSGDGGTYICQTPRYLGQPGSEVRVSLSVERPDPNRADSRPQFVPCKPYEATCGNGDCIPKKAVCDGKPDCKDRSDEEMCTFTGICEPNQFQCANRKCVLKTWLCDSDNDCGDNSDEMDCEPQDPGQPCLATEFACSTNNQCVPKSFHCDGRSDCFDGSDEIGCAPVHITKPPQPSNLKLNPGDTLILTAEAAGVPTPIISWRLNWGHVPPQCVSTSENGIGTLTCPNMRPEHSGAYSAEAINNRATTFATPDSIVLVSQTSPCPDGYFNNEARSERECIRCFCFGESTHCQSADLFTYVLPTPLGQGGTRLVGVTVTPSGEVRTDSSINNHYYYQPLRNGATVTKLESYDERSLGNFHPYLTLPETYNGNQLTSYGGHIKFTMSPHRRAFYVDESAPAIIVKGKYATLFNFQNGGDSSNDISIDIRFTPENWKKPGRFGFEPAAREDIMMALDQVDTILLRADLNNAGVNISNFVMESADNTNVGLGAASLVEECTCPPGYEGLSCQKCSAGYVREKSGPWLGNCVREACPAGTYGDPSRGIACKPCPCPLTNRGNQFARTCSLGSDGTVSCDCAPGYDGKNCEVCAPGYEGNPLVVGDSCRVKAADRCNPIGTRETQLLGECACKDHVTGRFCDQCKNDSFYLSNDFRHGCALCFCSGVSQQCMSSNLRRRTTSVNFNVPAIVEQVSIYESAPTSGGLRYTSPVATELKPVVARNGLAIQGQDRSRPKIYYWSLPYSFAGDKVTSYGGYLRYTLENIPSYIDPGARNNAADVQLISDNHLVFQYTGNFQPTPEGVLTASVQFLEKGWHRSDGKDVSREHFLLALADVKTILIKATYATDGVARPLFASIDTAEPDGDGLTAPHVEQCVCPTGYVGTSCEDCAPGYTRSSQGLYLEHCGLCECNGRSRECHPETGECYGCMDNTEGPHCELCKPGYERDRYDNCVATETSTALPCRCDPRGTEAPCDESGRCYCKANVEGENCDRCRAGTFSLQANNPDGCTPCYCSGATQDCQEANHYFRMSLAAPILGDNYGGYSLTDLNGEIVINDKFVPLPDMSELMYVFNFPASRELYWSLPVFPGNRVLSYGGSISLRQEFKSNNYDAQSTPGTDVVLIGDGISVFWTNPNTLRSGQSLSFQVPLRETNWRRLGSTVPASRSDFMRVLKNLRQVLVRATVNQDIISTSIADVSMDIATDVAPPDSPVAIGVEICTCPPGHMGTSCESCTAGYYKDAQDYCTPCPCAGHDCQLDAYGQVTCNCRPPYTGRDCSALVDESLVTTVGPPPPKSTVTVRITSPRITIREVGNSVNFTCQAQSIMTTRPLRISWQKVDGELPLDRTYIDEYSGLLQITNLQQTDSGVYICQTRDGVSTGQDKVTLRVPPNDMRVPTVNIQPVLNDYYEGDRIVLECVVTGNPTPTITWQRASRLPLPQNSYSDYYQLIIDRASVSDSGEYSCVALNTVGTGMRTAVINIRPRPSRPQVDKLTVSSISPVVYEGQSISVVCTGTIRVPVGSIDWIRQDNKPFEANVRSDNGVLYIDRATLTDQGVYICQSEDPTVPPAIVSISVIPLSTPAPGDNADITVSVKSLKIPAGESGTVDCTPSGYPLPMIRWSKHEGEFGPGTSQRGNMLIINNAQESDNGYYTCEALVDGKPITNIYVYVEIEKRESPRVEIWPPGEQPVNIGNTFEIQCRVLGGIPEPIITWSRGNGRPLSPTTTINTNNILRFERVDVNDEGEYICSGSNQVGTASASAVVKVRSPPEIHLSSNYIEVHLGEPLNVECRANGYPEPMVSIRGPNRREVAPPSPGIAALRVPSASEADDGKYSCVATSPAGTIEDNFLVQVERGDGGDNAFDGSGDDSINNEFEQDRNPYNPDRPSDLIVQDGQPKTEIDCSVSEGFSAKWDRSDQRQLQNNAEQQGNKLVIYNVSSSDSGQYVCSMYNYETGDIQTARYISLLVVRRPRITLRPETQSVRPGQSPTVECIVEGDDIIDVHWESYNRSPSPRVDFRNATLIFHQIEIEDAGQYQCFARNRYMNSSAIAEVIVAEEDEGADSHANEQWARVGDAVHLSCNVSSDARVKWTKNGRTVPRLVHLKSDGSLFIKHTRISDTGHYECHVTDSRGRSSNNYINLHIEGSRDTPGKLVEIDQPRRKFIPGENVEVLCKSLIPGTDIHWEKYGTRQYVEVRSHGYGVLLIIRGVSEADAGVYRCVGVGAFGSTSTDDFNLEVEPTISNPTNPGNPVEARYTARLGDSISMPCNHNLEEPFNIKWRREYSSLPQNVRSDQPILYLTNVNEGDAGTYVCRVSNNRAVVEARAILQVTGVVPMFNGEGWVALPTIKDSYQQLDIEVSFKPADNYGLILYNSQNKGRTGDYLALQLNDGVPEYIVETGNGAVVVKGDRPLQLNTWHTIRLSRLGTRVSMDVDNTGPFVNNIAENWLLELQEPLYVGGVPNIDELPEQLAGASGFHGCVSMLIIGHVEINILMDALTKYNYAECDSCSPNLCLNNGVCQEARNERGYVCICTDGYAGQNCSRRGEACHPGLCGAGKCQDTADGYRCICPVTFTGRNCQERQHIEYPAFTGSAYLALKPPNTYRFLKLEMKVKAAAPVKDGIIMYCAESPRGLGGFTSLAVRNQRLEFRYDLNEGNPVVLVSNTVLPPNVWTDVQVTRSGSDVSLIINKVKSYEKHLDSATKSLKLKTPMFVGGVDETITLNNNTGVSGGFNGCIKDLMTQGNSVDLVNSSIQSANVQECSNSDPDRGDIPEGDYSSCPCINGGACNPDGSCSCPPAFTGRYCESRTASSLQTRRPDPCAARPCRNGGICKVDYRNMMNHSCDCPLGYAGASCQMVLELFQNVGFSGNGYIELPASLVRYNNDDEPTIIALAFHTTNDGVLFYQRETNAPLDQGDFILLKIDRGYVVLSWDMGDGISSLTINTKNGFVADGDRHAIVVKLLADNMVELSVDTDTVSRNSPGLASVMNADSNLYIGGVPESLELDLPGLVGCIEQVEFMSNARSINLGEVAVAGRNAQRCRDSRRTNFLKK